MYKPAHANTMMSIQSSFFLSNYTNNQQQLPFKLQYLTDGKAPDGYIYILTYSENNGGWRPLVFVLLCLFGVRQLLWTEPGALYMLGKHSTTEPYMQILDDIFGQVTKRATNSKGQVNSVCSLVWCREKEINNNIPLALFLIKLNNFRKTRKTLIYHFIIIIKPVCFQDEVTEDEKDWGPVLQENTVSDLGQAL